MRSSRYRASINGFWCQNETWDDGFNWGGKPDEVSLVVNTKLVDANGSISQNFDSLSEVMDGTWQSPSAYRRFRLGQSRNRHR